MRYTNLHVDTDIDITTTNRLICQASPVRPGGPRWTTTACRRRRGNEDRRWSRTLRVGWTCAGWSTTASSSRQSKAAAWKLTHRTPETQRHAVHTVAQNYRDRLAVVLASPQTTRTSNFDWIRPTDTKTSISALKSQVTAAGGSIRRVTGRGPESLINLVRGFFNGPRACQIPSYSISKTGLVIMAPQRWIQRNIQWRSPKVYCKYMARFGTSAKMKMERKDWMEVHVEGGKESGWQVTKRGGYRKYTDPPDFSTQIHRHDYGTAFCCSLVAVSTNSEHRLL